MDSGTLDDAGAPAARWYHGHSGEWSYFAGELTLLALRDHAGPAHGCVLSSCASLGHGTRFHVYYPAEDIERQRAFARELLCDPVRMRDVLDGTQQAERSLRSFWCDWAWDGATDGPTLAALLQENHRRTSALLAYYQLSGSYLSADAEQRIRSACRTVAFDAHDVVQCLLASDARGLDAHRERVDWLGLCEWWLDGNRHWSDASARLHAHTERYVHLGFGLGMSADSDFAFRQLARRLQFADATTLAALRTRVHAAAALGADCEALATECAGRLRLSPELLRLCRAIAQLSVARLSERESFDYNLARRMRVMQQVFERLRSARRYQRRDRHRHLLSIDDIDGFLRAGVLPDHGRLRRRARLSVMLLADGEMHRLDGTAARVQRRRLRLPEHAGPERTQLRGTPVAGVTAGVGRALVLRVGDSIAGRQIADDASLDGCVVVTATVRPFLVPLCTRAAAIVTEEGGLTSHAAVVARELRIPCVVGVAGATRAVATGDPLFVSVRTGKVRRLSAARMAVLQRTPVRPVPRCRPGRPIEDADLRCNGGPLLVPLGAATARDVRRVGGKAAALAPLAPWSPPGIVVTTDAITASLHETGSELLREPLARWLREIGWDRVAVRSSHVDENAADQSYAGLFESVLDVRAADIEHCMSAIRHVVKSGTAAHLEHYSGAGVHTSPVAMAVIVQGMIEPVLSGVLLGSSRQRRHEWMVLEYTAGRLDPLMAGAITPLRSACRRETNRMPTADMLVPPVSRRVLSSDTIDELLHHAWVLERQLGAPQEMEWAVDAADRLWILQTRSLVSRLRVLDGVPC